MRTFQNIGKSLLITASLLVLASCHKDDNNYTPQVPYVVSSSIHAKINGVDFASVNAVASRVGSSNGNGSLITIQGGAINANTIVIAIDKITAPGTFQISPNQNYNDSMLAFLDSSTSKSYDTSDCSQASGTIVVTTLTDSKIEGTFNFIGKDDDNCSDSRTVTNGTFTATLSH